MTHIVTIAYGVLVVAPVVLGLKFGIRVTIALYAFEVILLLAMSCGRGRPARTTPCPG